MISMSVKAAETHAEEKDHMHCPKGKVAEAYMNLTQEVLKNENRSVKDCWQRQTLNLL